MTIKKRNKEGHAMSSLQDSTRSHLNRRRNVLIPSTSSSFSWKSKMFTIFLPISLNLCVLSVVGGSAIHRSMVVPPSEIVKFSASSLAKRDTLNATNPNGGDLISEDDSFLNWTIERKECGQLDEGCFCESKSRNATIVRCRCDGDYQVAHLKPPGRGRDIKHASLFVQKVHWTWRFEHCSKVVLHPEFLATVEGSPFQVEFYNISQFQIYESAFATRDAYSSHGGQNQVSVHFSHCKMDSLPTKTFPSYLNTIKFTKCSIKSLGRRFIHSLKMDRVEIEQTRIDNIDSDAFYAQTIIDTMVVSNSTILSVSRNAVASAINKMIWEGTLVQVLQEDALSGAVAAVLVRDSEFNKIEPNGFSFKSWSNVTFENNSFGAVSRKGIDLSHSSENQPNVELINNKWGKVERDFILTGSSENPFIEVRNNSFLEQCDCGNTFTSHFTTNGSRPWFHEEILNNSRCPVKEQVLSCLMKNEQINSTAEMLEYDQLHLLCDPQLYMCLNDVSEIATSSEESIPGRPQLPNRLRVLAYFIAAMGIFIICSLLVTMCVFLCRKKIPRKKSPSDSPLQNLENAAAAAAQGKKSGMSKSLSGGEYADIVFKQNHNNLTTGSSRPRSVLLEDVEMEDKGVQTMPTELSSEVLEGLREKLSRPDSFWDAKETIDHLYDLIQVKELSGLSSPPDVTMCNGQSSSSTTASTARLLPSTSSSPVTAQISTGGVSVSVGGSDPQLHHSKDTSPVSETPPPLPATSPPSGVPPLQQLRYAQIRNKVKTAPICEYADPSDSSMHIYSELTPQLHSPGGGEQRKSPSKHQPSPDTSPLKNAFLGATKRLFSGGGGNSGPILCEYTDPKDVQTHVYAELSNSQQKPSQNNLSPVRVTTPQNCQPSEIKTTPTKLNTITIAVPPPPIIHPSIPHSSSFHNSPRLFNKLKESSEQQLSSSNPSLHATNITTPVKILHQRSEGGKTIHPRFPPSEKLLKRSTSHVDASPKKLISATSKNLSMLNVGGGARNASTGSSNGSGASASDTQKRPLPSIPSWSDRNEGKSQF